MSSYRKTTETLYYEAILSISANPYIGEAKTGYLAGVYGYDIKYKGTSYEIAYRISTRMKMAMWWL
ncbi:MAG: type II toxin-antitoxin system RelE/ParE family toxin [Thermoactinomyces sp.]